MLAELSLTLKYHSGSSGRGLTALWQTLSTVVLRSLRPILIRQCSVRPLRCRPEQ